MKSTLLLALFTGLLMQSSVAVGTSDCSDLPSNVSLSCSDEDRPDSQAFLHQHRVSGYNTAPWCGYFVFGFKNSFEFQPTEHKSYQALQCALSQLPACADYTYEIFLIRGQNGTQEKINITGDETPKRGSTIPPVENLRVSSLEGRTLSLTWNFTAQCKNVTFNVTYKISEEEDQEPSSKTESVILPGNTSQYNIRDTLPNFSYVICVAVLYHNSSSDTKCVEKLTPLVALRAPKKLTLESINTSAMTVRWQSTPDFADVGTEYVVSYVECDASNFSIRDTRIPKSEEGSEIADYHVTLSGLQPDTKYCISVKGVTKSSNGTEVVAMFFTASDAPPAQGSEEHKKRNIIIGLVCAAVVLVAIAVALLMLVRKNIALSRIVHENRAETMESRRQMYYGQLEEKFEGKKLEMILEKQLLITEYQQVDEMSPVLVCEAALLPQNANKNRPMAALPFDHSRVVLRRKNSKHDSDYINANHIPNIMNSACPRFIAAQSPMLETINSFWQMVWEQNVNQIVMIAQTDEDGQDVCTRYFPISKYPHFKNGDFKIYLKEEISIDGMWYEREMIVTKDSAQRVLKHYQYTSWPTPSQRQLPSVRTFSYFVHAVRVAKDNVVLAHCDTGSGRTGVFLALWNIQLGAENFENELNVTMIVHHMRKYRRNLVENKVQFFFLNKCCRFYLTPHKGGEAGDEENTLEDYDSDETTMIMQSRLSLN